MAQVKKIPMRKCVGCGEMKNKKELLRVLRTPEGNYMIDTTGRANGRGAYLCSSRECLEKAIRSKGLERSFKAPIAEDVYESLRKELSGIE